MFCPKCGTQNSPTGKFCQQCGTPLVQAPSQPVQGAPPPAPVKKSGSGWVFWVVLIVLFVVLWQVNQRGGGDAALFSFLDETFGSSCSAPVQNNSGGGESGSYYGSLSVSSDGGDVYVGSTYLGRGGGVISLAPGTYTVSCYSASTGKLVWQKKAVVISGKTSVVKDNTYAR